MAYLKPSAFTRRVFNPIMGRLTPGAIEDLSVIGRRSNRPHHTPVQPVVVGGSEYLVAVYGDTQWSRNLRASGIGELTHHGHHRSVRAQEVSVAERGPILAVYRQEARSVEAPFRTLPDPADHPVFRLSPMKSTG